MICPTCAPVSFVEVDFKLLPSNSLSYAHQGCSGDPCGIANLTGDWVPPLEICPHTHIVGFAVLGNQYANFKEIPDDYSDQIDIDGKTMGSAKAEWRDGGDGSSDGGGDSGDGGSDGDGDGRTTFTGKILHLLKVTGVLKFPVNPVSHLSDAASKTVLGEGSLIPCHESVCSVCGEELLVTEHKDGVAVTQVSPPVCTGIFGQSLSVPIVFSTEPLWYLVGVLRTGPVLSCPEARVPIGSKRRHRRTALW